MSHRLADYFVIVGYDQERSGAHQGKILQRFPEKDWNDTPFIEGIELFCQPSGWNLSLNQEEPKYFMSVLTNVDGNHYYCAVLSFYEKISIVPSKPADEEEENITLSNKQILSAASTITHHNIMYAPKCLVLVSRLDYSETFKNCLKTIYTVYIENLPFMIETLIGNILGCIQVPIAGGPQVRFSIGAGDKQALQPPLSPTLPVTGSCVRLLFKQLGMKNVLLLYCAAMTEHKILFHSSSFSRLTEGCRALTALMYPLRYTHTYVPILPASLLEILSTPTPFIMGINSNMQNEVNDVLDVIVVDLDGGSIYIPESLISPVSKLPTALWESTNHSLTIILQPELAEADNAFSNNNHDIHENRNQVLVDKEIRAVFMRIFAQLMQGYRSCLTLIRINPKPVIEFHKAAFLGSRDVTDTDFLARVLDSMFFTTFVTERGPPWRSWDAWDELYNVMPELLKSELQDRRLILKHIQELAQKLYINENPNPQVYQQKILTPPEGAFSRIHHPEFPRIDSQQVQTIIHEGISKNDFQSKLQSYRNNPRIVPLGPHLPSFSDGLPNVTARKMEVIKNCVNFIFENKISDARKIFPAVIRILKQRDDARLFLCRELARFVQGSNKATLEHPQFDLVCKLMNRALQDDSPKFQHDIAANLLPLSVSFCRKLSPTVMQFAYSCIQGHAIWKTQTFWEQAFYQEVQVNIKNLYINKPIDRSSFFNESVQTMVNSPYDYKISQEPSALEIAAKQMMDWPSIDAERQKDLLSSEEQILYSQALHYANRMISLQLPLDVRSNTKVKKFSKPVDDDASISNSVLESRSDQSTDGYEDRDASEVEQNVVRQVCKFIDKVCNEGGVTPDHIRKLHSIIPGLVDMQCETLDVVCRESKRIPPVQKPKISPPTLLIGEEFLGDSLRTILLVDGREETLSPLLPAEGALFLTNYRVIFKGLPIDSLTCEQNVIRSFPVASLTKEKRISGILSNEQVLPDGLQLRSCTFQLIKVAFDEEVTQEAIEIFRKTLNRARHPEDEFGHFAFANNFTIAKPQNQKIKEKNATLKGFAKKTLLKTAMKAGFKQKGTTKRKYNFSGINDVEAFYNSTQGYNNNNNHNNNNNNNNDNSDDDDVSEDIDTIPRLTVKDVEKLKERSFVKDWQRLNLASNGYRISTINCNYSLCRTYPALIVCPRSINDDQLKSLSKTYKNQRIPVPTWRHQNGAVILRSALSLAKSVMGMLKSGSGNTSIEGKVDGLQDQDRYFCAIIPHNNYHQQHQSQHLSHGNILSSESNISIDSLLGPKSHLTPISNRKNDVSGLRIINQKPNNKWESLKRNAGRSNDYNQYDDHLSIQSPLRVPLYMLSDRSQSKSLKLSELGVEYIPVYYNDNRHSREAFKKLMRACLPSNINNEPDNTFPKLIEQSEWLQQIRSLLQLSGTVVDLIDLHEASVNISFEEGWDITCQVSSLAQLCLDPHYRTIEGFRVLIEKEWLAFGHRFGYRSNLKQNSSSFAPIFLQFLDAVHQIQLQFPLSFEFNEFYLKFIAYHSVSCRFRTFLFDCEFERFDLGITAVEDKRGSLNSHKHMVETGTASDDESIYPGGLRSSNSNQPKLGISVFDYIEKHHVRSPIFFNFKYTADPNQHVLRPQSSVNILEVWDFYTNEELAQGPSYDLELIGSEVVDEETEYSLKQPKRKVVTIGYDNIYRNDPDAFSQLLEELKQAESERGILPQKWKQVWDKLELPHSDSLTRHSSFNSALVRSHGRYLHNIATMDILRRGHTSGYQELSHPHRFEKHVYTTPTNCNLCGNLLWGPVRNGVRCMDCGNSYHEKCADSAPKNCTKYKNIEGPQTLMSVKNLNDKQETCSIASNNTNDVYHVYASNIPENRTHEGYLYKRGALLKGWKQRWFVLDSMKHQLRYYDSVEDSNCKGIIELAEVQSVGQAVSPFQVTTSKKIDEKAFFDLKTAKRTYNFCAIDPMSAQEWVEKIQACLQ